MVHGGKRIGRAGRQIKHREIKESRRLILLRVLGILLPLLELSGILGRDESILELEIYLKIGPG